MQRKGTDFGTWQLAAAPMFTGPWDSKAKAYMTHTKKIGKYDAVTPIFGKSHVEIHTFQSLLMGMNAFLKLKGMILNEEQRSRDDLPMT